MKYLAKEKHIYKCILCKVRLTETLHEIIHGNGFRPISEKYAFQVPLCSVCHDNYHRYMNKQERIDKIVEWVEWLGHDYKTVITEFHQYDKRDTDWFESVKQGNIDRIMSLES